jgi:cullin 3
VPQVDDRFKSEISRTQYYLASTTEGPLVGILKEYLLTPHLEKVVSMPNSGLDVMIDKEMTDDLGRLYRLFFTVPNGLVVLRKALKDSILRRGKEANAVEGAPQGDFEAEDEAEEDAAAKGKGKGKEKEKEPPKKKGKAAPPVGAAAKAVENAIQWVQNVLDLKDRFDKLLKDCFENDIHIQTTLNEVRFTN